MKWLDWMPATKGDIRKEREQRMAGDADLKAAVARVASATSKEIKAIADKLSAQGGVSEADAELLAGQLNATADNLDAETAALTATPAAPQP